MPPKGYTGAVIKQVNSANAAINDTIPFSIAAKAKSSQSAGLYENNINFAVVANPLPVMTFNQAFANAGKSKQGGYYTMQDMSTSICNAVTTGTSNDGIDTQATQLIDTRDNKVYWVAKLMDGKCWMTQNLDLVLNTGTTLTRENTDLNGNVYAYTPKHNTTTGSLSTAQTDEYSWESGEVYWKDSEQWRTSTNAPSANGLIGASSPFKDYFTATMPTTEGKHYHIGNYYQWATATAGSGNEVTTGGIEASSSICPRGWRLPDSGNNTNDYSFGKMLSQYGLQDTNTQHNINKAPLYFVPTGAVYVAMIWEAAYGGSYWSSRSSSDTDAYNLGFGASVVFPSDSYERYSARTVRCVAR